MSIRLVANERRQMLSRWTGKSTRRQPGEEDEPGSGLASLFAA
jgi:hypothetical protein